MCLRKNPVNSSDRAEETTERRDGSEERSFRERVEGPGMGAMGGGNPMAEMMGGMMGPGGMGGGPGGPLGGAGGQKSDSEELVSELRQLRDEMRDQTRTIERIADAIEDG